MHIQETEIQPTENHITPLAALKMHGHEKILYYHDAPTGLKVIVAIHNTTLGPSLGGTRMYNYHSEEAALSDVLKLSKGMSYKSALAGLDLGGGKAVLVGDPKTLKNEAYFRRYGEFIESLHGAYITGPDVNTNMDDMVHISKQTKHVVGLPVLYGGSGDPSILTAYGTYMGMKAAVKKLYGKDSLLGKKIAVEGVGKVGSILIGYLVKEGAIIYIKDIQKDKIAAVAQSYPVEVIADEKTFYGLDVDIYAPCALGATINNLTIEQFNCKAIVGAANNQLADEPSNAKTLLEKNILYAPDFLVNAGGVINVHTEYYGTYNAELAHQKVEDIYHTCLNIWTASGEEKISAHEVAVRLAEERIASVKKADISVRKGGSIGCR